LLVGRLTFSFISLTLWLNIKKRELIYGLRHDNGEKKKSEKGKMRRGEIGRKKEKGSGLDVPPLPNISFSTVSLSEKIHKRNDGFLSLSKLKLKN
jgi:hypothetical protein